MSYEIPGGTLSLACPLIANPAKGVKKPLYLLPFPEIDLNLEGFTFPHLRWVGINVSNSGKRKQLIELARFHEDCHKELALTPYSLCVKDVMVGLYCEMFSVFCEEREEISVPLDPKKSRNRL